MSNDFSLLDAQNELASLAQVRCDEVQGVSDENPFRVTAREIEAEQREEYNTARQAEAEMSGTLYSMTDMGRND